MSDETTSSGDDSGKLLYCSFCGKSQHEVRKLIAGPSVFICDECVDLCNDIIREEVQESGGDASQDCQGQESQVAFRDPQLNGSLASHPNQKQQNHEWKNHAHAAGYAETLGQGKILPEVVVQGTIRA